MRGFELWSFKKHNCFHIIDTFWSSLLKFSTDGQYQRECKNSRDSPQKAKKLLEAQCISMQTGCEKYVNKYGPEILVEILQGWGRHIRKENTRGNLLNSFSLSAVCPFSNMETDGSHYQAKERSRVRIWGQSLWKPFELIPICKMGTLWPMHSSFGRDNQFHKEYNSENFRPWKTKKVEAGMHCFWT